MPTVGSSILRRQRSSSAANKKLGVTRISDTAASSRGTRADNAHGDPTTPSPTAMSRAPAPSRSPPTPEPMQQRAGYNAGAQPMNRAKHLSPPKRSNLQDWDEWGAFENEVASAVTSVASTVTNMVNGNQRGAGNRGGGSSRYSPAQGRTPTRDNQAHHSVHDFMAATGAADVVNVVGRAAAFLGTAIDNAIENTAAVVENVSKRADQMAFVNSPKHGTGNSPGRRRRSSPGKHNDVNGNYRAPLSNLSPNSGLNKANEFNASSPSRRWNKNPRSPGGRRTPNKGGSKSPGGGNGSNGNNKIRVFRSPGSSGKKSRSRTSGEGSRPAAIPMKTGDAVPELADEDWGWDAKSPTQAEKTRNVAAATAHLRRELTTVNAERDELVDAMSTLTKKLKALTDDHESLKKQNLGLQKRMASSHHESQLPGGSDPLAEQVRHQLEHLVKEKGKLAQENASLRRECESLQELLMYSNMASQVESMYSPGGIFGDVYGAEETEAEADEETDGEYVAEETETVETSEAADDEPGVNEEAFETGMLEAAEVEVVEETPAADVEAVNADADADAEVEVVEPPEAPEDVVEVVAPAAEPEPEPEPEPVVAADDIEPEAPAVPEVTEASEAPTGKKGKGKGKGKGKKGRR